VNIAAPTLADLHETARIFNGFANVDRTWWELIEATAGNGAGGATRPALRLSDAAHRDMLLRWLNSWGCRIRYARDGEPPLFDTGLAQWWETWGGDSLPSESLVRLSDNDIVTLAGAYAALAEIPVSVPPRGRSLGPTAGSKALYALRPGAAMPWDAAIATRLYAGRDGAAFERHLRQGRAWGLAVLAESGLAEDELATVIGRPGISLAKILDEYCYTSVTMKH
jgi:hypothetical protein